MSSVLDRIRIVPTGAALGADDPRELPGPQHPILRTHPESGRKALYLGRRFGAYIVGLPLVESESSSTRSGPMPPTPTTSGPRNGSSATW